MTNPYIAYAFFPTVDQLPVRPPPVKNNYCELLGRDLEADRITINYCECEKCPLMPTVKEAVCCFDVLEASTTWANGWRSFMGENDGCVTTHEKIIKAINRIDELDNFIQMDKIRLREKARYTRSVYIDEYDIAEENDKYRFACYRKITFLVHDGMSIGKRVQLPACVVTAVRNKYPSQTGTYKGFEEFFGVDEIE